MSRTTPSNILSLCSLWYWAVRLQCTKESSFVWTYPPLNLQSPKHCHRLVVRPGFESWTFGMVTQYHNQDGLGHQPGVNLRLSRIRSIIELNKMAVYLGVIWFLYHYKVSMSLPIYCLWLFSSLVMVLGNHPKGPGFKSRSECQSMTKFQTLLCCSTLILL